MVQVVIAAAIGIEEVTPLCLILSPKVLLFSVKSVNFIISLLTFLLYLNII
jgi:hypothetical protein